MGGFPLLLRLSLLFLPLKQQQLERSEGGVSGRLTQFLH